MAKLDSKLHPNAAAEAVKPGPGAAEAGKAERDVLLSWTVSLVRKGGLLKPVVALAVIGGILALGAYLYRDALLVLFAATVFFLATADYFFPMRFWLTREAAFRKTFFGTKFIRWTKVKLCYLDDKGIKLSPLEKRSRAEALRGLFLYFGDNRDELVETVRNLTSGNRG
jgi:hypothetical protein